MFMNIYDVSIIIPTLDEEKNIAACIQAIKSQTFPQEKIETIVVDCNSSDKTVEIAGQFTDNIYASDPGWSVQRNLGVEKSKGKYIYYLDADMILSENVIRECFDACENEGYTALFVPEIIIGEGFWIKVRNFERSFYNATCVESQRFVNREKFLEIGGFDVSLFAGEEWDFNRRISDAGPVGIIDAPVYHNEGKFNLKKYLSKKGYYSTTVQRYINKWGKNDPLVRKQLGIWYRFFGVFIENGKWIRLIKHPILTVCMYFLRFMVGLQFIRNR